jgi:TPP-dependent pyruvate/acetoin dehydrogenase alpha subunit
MYDPELYRTKEEVEHWKEHDPISTFVERVRGDVLSDDDVQSIEAEVATELDQAVAYAEGGTLEPVGDLARHVTYEGMVA